MIHIFIVHIVNKTVIFKKETMTKRKMRNRQNKRNVKDREKGWRGKQEQSSKK